VAGPQSQGPWWDVTPEPENPSPYYDSILYSEIPALLRELEVNSNRVKVEVAGQSAGGRNLFLVTLSAPEAMGRLGQYQAIRQTMLKDPEKAQEKIDKLGDFKVPVYINGSIHGDEYPGTDAALRLLETLAYGDSEEVQMILDNVILLVMVNHNPDGRVMGTRRNANGFDVNRDFITQSQPETRAAVQVMTEWNPMTVLDLHGFVNPMIIDPCTPPHNPNNEYDLYIKWALDEAEAGEAEVLANTGLPVQIPFRDGYCWYSWCFPAGWDDWTPIYVPMYAMYHGAYGHTLETPVRNETGVDAHYWAVWGMLKYIAENREEMVRDQIEVFRRGFLGLPQIPIPEELLARSWFDHYNDLTTIEFPAAYVIPAEAPAQQNPHEAAKLVDFLLFNDVQVEQASQAFKLNGAEFPKGTYIVWMDQPKRGLANTILWAGWDISDDPGLTMYDISGWSHPLLWGVSRAEAEESLDVKTRTVNKAAKPQGSAEGGKAAAYAYLPTNNEAILATNKLLARGVMLYRTEESFTDAGRAFGAGTFVIPADQDGARSLANELANQYGFDVFALASLPAGVTLMRPQRVAVYADEGVGFFLKEYGFDYDEISDADMIAGIDLSGYDVFINSGWWSTWDGLDPTGHSALQAFFAGGGDYIGIGNSGADLAVKSGLVNVTYETGDRRDNGVIMVDYESDHPVAGQYPADGHAFVFGPVWFTDWDPGLEVAARIDAGPEFLVSGFWTTWDASGAEGNAIALHGPAGLSDVTLLGLHPTFRAHTRHTFRILANAIYNGLD
jgi:hypothetical protein